MAKLCELCVDVRRTWNYGIRSKDAKTYHKLSPFSQVCNPARHSPVLQDMARSFWITFFLFQHKVIYNKNLKQNKNSLLLTNPLWNTYFIILARIAQVALLFYFTDNFSLSCKCQIEIASTKSVFCLFQIFAQPCFDLFACSLILQTTLAVDLGHWKKNRWCLPHWIQTMPSAHM